MKRFDINRYDMLVRVSAFGTANRDLFPASTLGGRMFTALASAVRQLGDYVTSEASGLGGLREGVLSKASARASLRDGLDAIARTARALAIDTPGLDGKFRVPSGRGDHDLVTAAKMFLADASALSASFVAHGLPHTFLADLRAKLVVFERSAREHVTARESQVGARAGIDAALEAALTAMQRLDAIVPNRLRENPTLRAQWSSARRVMRVRSASQPAVQPVPPASTATPVAEVHV